MTEYIDNLPLDGEVYLKGDTRIYIYRGYLSGQPNKCAVEVKSEKAAAASSGSWVDRSYLTPVQEPTA